MRKDQQLMSKKAIVNQSRNDIMETQNTNLSGKINVKFIFLIYCFIL